VEVIDLVTGYVFIDAEKGRALEVVSEIVKIKGVKTACAVTGTFDVIATFEVKEIKDIGEAVVKGIHGVDGVYLTQTAICVKCCEE
jgi:DNA-binding Lrp family transcriptional regulator